MPMQALDTVLQRYGLNNYSVVVLQSGLINATYKVTAEKKVIILQQINHDVFKTPEAIDENLQLLNNYFYETSPNYLFTKPLKGLDNKTLYCLDGKYFRAFDFIENTTTVNVIENASQAFEAAKAFGEFTFLLNDFDAAKLNITLPNFHNLTLRYQQFKTALETGNQERITACFSLIEQIENASSICKVYEHFIANAAAIKRVTHHDTKISNVLFDEAGKAICVIDLDTVMPGYFLSDVGDMIRTYVCPVSEEEQDFTKIEIRSEILQAIQNGYLHFMQSELTSFEKQHFFFAGEMMIYMQALRFITDYFNNDCYYSIQYAEQNLVRATNQMHLLKALQEHLKHIVT